MKSEVIMIAIEGRVSRVMFAIAGLALVGSMFLTVADATLRSFGSPILGSGLIGLGIFGYIAFAILIPYHKRITWRRK